MTKKINFLRLGIVEASGSCPRWGSRSLSAACHSKTEVALANPQKGSL